MGARRGDENIENENIERELKIILNMGGNRKLATALLIFLE